MLIMRLLVTDGGHGDHQEVDAVPVGQSLAVVKVRGVSRVLQEMDDAWGPVTPSYTLHLAKSHHEALHNRYIHYTRYRPAAASHTEMNIALIWHNLRGEAS